MEALRLGLGYNLFLQGKDENPIDFDHLSKDICPRYSFQDKPPRILKSPKLYAKTPNWDPDEAHAKIEKPLSNSKKRTAILFFTRGGSSTTTI
mgnify:CR=1 FL=1